MSLQNRLEKAHQAEVDELKARLGEGVRELEAREEARRKLAEELTLEKERARAREEELSGEVERVRSSFVKSDTEVARLEAQLDIRTRELEESESKVGRMNGLCRRQVRRMLKGQRGEFKKVCKKQIRRAVNVVRNYLEARRPWNRVDKLVSQAEEAERILLHLRSGGVPIPDEKLAAITAAKERHLADRAQIEEKTLSAQDFEFCLPSDLGVPNLDQVDFSAGFAFGEGEEDYWGGSGDDEEEDEEEAEEGEDEGSEEGEEEDEEEEEDVLPAAKGAAPGARSDVEGSRPVLEASGSGKETEAGGVALEAREDAGEIQSEGDRVATAAEGDRLGEAPLGGETTLPLAEGIAAEVRPEGGAQLGREKTPPSVEGEPSDVPGGGESDRVQLEGDVTPPARDE